MSTTNTILTIDRRTGDSCCRYHVHWTDDHQKVVIQKAANQKVAIQKVANQKSAIRQEWRSQQHNVQESKTTRVLRRAWPQLDLYLSMPLNADTYLRLEVVRKNIQSRQDLVKTKRFSKDKNI